MSHRHARAWAASLLLALPLLFLLTTPNRPELSPVWGGAAALGLLGGLPKRRRDGLA